MLLFAGVVHTTHAQTVIQSVEDLQKQSEEELALFKIEQAKFLDALKNNNQEEAIIRAKNFLNHISQSMLFVKAKDEAGNESQISNITSITTARTQGSAGGSGSILDIIKSWTNRMGESLFRR